MASLVLSPAEQDFIIRGIEKGFRGDGRGNLDRREVTLRTGMISQASGSARCRIGNLGVGTDVLVGVKAEVNAWTPGEPEALGSVVCNVECSPSAAQEFEGRGAEEINVELTQLLDRVIGGGSQGAGGLDLSALCIIPKQAYWVLHVDALVLDVRGSIADALVMAARAALMDTRLPRVVVETITDDSGAAQAEFDVVDDAEDLVALKGVSGLPVAVTFNQVGKRYVVDASEQEEAVTQAKLTVAVSPALEICAIQKGGIFRGFQPSLMSEILQTAQRIAKEELTRFVALYEEAAKHKEQQSDGPSTGSTFLVAF
ncbi:hypothetical protein H4S06_004024 [Coemansia sp. BCRC 34490]|nr:hypothetical protein LPJ72_001586 [Coemansia sp. Benny D160-2]KAJ2751993.1 hypothetical protein H4S06_004024 [Coemansia sp. BCRC 34490]